MDVYNSLAFINGLLNNLVRSKSVMSKAVELGLQDTDFSTSEAFGLKAYQIVAGGILKIGIAPINQGLLITYVKAIMDEVYVNDALLDQVANIVIEIYDEKLELVEDYYLRELQNFIKFRRIQKAKISLEDSPEKFAAEVNKLNIQFDNAKLVNQTESLFPFAQRVTKSQFEIIPTGYTSLDAGLGGGLGYGEYTLLVGASGAGKTAFGCNIAYNTAKLGFPVTYISAEETKEDICARFYSIAYRIPYTGLHTGSETLTLESKWNDFLATKEGDFLVKNLNVQSIKDVAPVTPDQIYGLLVDQYEKTGFAPKLVIVDQLQFIIPNVQVEQAASWDDEKRASEDCDKLSHKLIGTDGYFSLIVLHQAKGKLQKSFDYSSIQGFKGIVQKTDNTFGIGKESNMDTTCDLFSLKCRHAKNFRLNFSLEDMQFMTIKEGEFSVNNDGSIESVEKRVERPSLSTMLKRSAEEIVKHTKNPMAE